MALASTDLPAVATQQAVVPPGQQYQHKSYFGARAENRTGRMVTISDLEPHDNTRPGEEPELSPYAAAYLMTYDNVYVIEEIDKGDTFLVTIRVEYPAVVDVIDRDDDGEVIKERTEVILRQKRYAFIVNSLL